MAIRIGSARIDERGKIAGGKAGDQTRNEVGEQDFYMHAKGWYRLRPKDPNVAEKMAEAMRQACANNNIGYDQNNRIRVITQLKKDGSLKVISVKVEADCSSLVRACIYQATGIDVGDFYTGNEASVLEASGLFEKRKSVSSSADVYNGDVLVTKSKGHTVIVTSGRSRTSSNETSDTSTNTTNSITNSKGSGYMFEPSTVQKGSKGNSVLLLQEILKARGYKGKDGKELSLDKDCGDNTAYAINTYQSARRKQGVELGTNGKNDGCCGPKMWKDLISL